MPSSITVSSSSMVTTRPRSASKASSALVGLRIGCNPSKRVAVVGERPRPAAAQIGGAVRRERVCQFGSTSGVAVLLPQTTIALIGIPMYYDLNHYLILLTL